MRGSLVLLALAAVVGCASPMGPDTPALGSAEAYIERAKSLLEEEKYPEAIDDLSAALEMDPHSAEAYFQRGRVHYDYAVSICKNLAGQPPEAVPFLPDEVVDQMDLAVADYCSAVELDP
ncbi:MAG TPA: tetratricopeptide repeat protein, partial [Chloroflexi bacterium]|nr:tetratricopeptide repeat protein [Chloroflexota bacterium]